MNFRVYIQLYPQMGGLGWLPVGDYRTREEALARKRELIAKGHAKNRVRVE